jgi:D,D-heptose 1,7-bisphosphate phosphatase
VSDGLTNQCVILIGGLGTRLGEVARLTPKPLIEVAGAPFLEIVIAEARRRGFTRFLLLAGHRSEAVFQFLAEREAEARYGCRIEVSVEPEPLGTGGALAYGLSRLDEDFLLINGDTWFDFNWRDLVWRGRASGFDAFMGLRQIERPDRYETIDLEGERVAAIRARGQPLERALINGGVHYLTRRAADRLSQPSSLESDLLAKLAAEGKLGGRSYDGFFIDIGVPEALAAAGELVPKARRRAAVFLDRDGVLNHDFGYVHRPDQIVWIEGAVKAVKALNEAGAFVFVVTNQGGVARGYYEETHIAELHAWMSDELARAGAYIDDWRYCPYHPEGVVERYRAHHDWRKPNPGMIRDLMKSWPIDPASSFLIGDLPHDVAAAEAAGLPGYQFGGGDLSQFLRALTPELKDPAFAARLARALT